MEKITVLLPFHLDNRKFLDQAVYSVLNSENVLVDLILIDNRIEYKTKISYTDRRIKYLSCSKKGYAASLNYALKFVSSDWVGLMNSDDLIHKQKFYQQVEELKQSQNHISITNLKRFGLFFNSSWAGNHPKYSYSPFLLFLGSYGANSTLVFNRRLYSDISFEEQIHSDWIFGLKNYFNLNISFIPKEFYLYRTHYQQITRDPKLNSEDVLPYLKFAYKAHLDLDLDLDIIRILAMPYVKSSRLKENDRAILKSVFAVIRNKLIDQGVNSKEVDNLLFRRAFAYFIYSKDFYLFISLVINLSNRKIILIKLISDTLQVLFVRSILKFFRFIKSNLASKHDIE